MQSNSKPESIEEECVVCLDELPEILLLPCKHKCMCNACYKAVMASLAKCPLCRADITGIAIGAEEAVEISPEIRKTYFQRREEFLKTIDLQCKNTNGDLIVSANSDVCLISRDMVLPVIVYYLGTEQYDPNNCKYETSFVGNRITFSNGEMVVQGPSATLTFYDFYKFVDETVVAERKFVDHLRDQIFQHYLSGSTVAVEDNSAKLKSLFQES